MTIHRRFAVVLIAFAVVAMPLRTFALSLRQYESESKQERAEFVAGAITKIVADVNKANPTLAKNIHDYFYVIPQGRAESPGLIAFAGELGAAENLADKGKLDRDKVQIEGILLTIIKRDVMTNQDSKSELPAGK